MCYPNSELNRSGGGAMTFDAFVGPAYRVSNLIADQEALVNLYPERMESAGAKARMVLNPTPGVEAFAMVANIGGKGIFAMDNRAFAVIANQVYEIFADGTTAARGPVAVDTRPATISSNGDGGGQLFITSGGNGYCYDLTSNVLTLELTGTATMGGMLDGYFLALDTTSSTLYVSDLLDGTSWDPTQFAQRSAAPDPWLSMIVTRNYIYLLGEQTSEVWYDAGSFPFPFALAPGSSMPYGTAAVFGGAIVGAAVTWLSHNADGALQVVQARGFTPTVISQRGVEYALSTYARVDDAEVLTYQDGGHLFYILNLPDAEATWAYDQTEGLWHQRDTWDATTSSSSVWRAQSHAHAFDQHLVLDRMSGTIYQLSNTFPTDFDGHVIRRVRRAPGLAEENRWLHYSRFELYLKTGIGTTTGLGSDPLVTLRTSNDGGRNWSAERQASAGALGATQTRVFWTRLGLARDRVFEVVVTDPVSWQWVGAFLQVSAERHVA